MMVVLAVYNSLGELSPNFSPSIFLKSADIHNFLSSQLKLHLEHRSNGSQDRYRLRMSHFTKLTMELRAKPLNRSTDFVRTVLHVRPRQGPRRG
jgi:hypothetical protein